MIRYLVTCPHDGQPGHVGEIIDARDGGRGVIAEDFRDHGTPVSPRNRRGSRRTFVFTCRTCQLRSPLLADTTIAELADAIGAAAKLDPSKVIGPIPLPIEESMSDPIAVLFDGVEEEWAQIGVEEWHAIGLKTLCELVTGLRDRGRR